MVETKAAAPASGATKKKEQPGAATEKKGAVKPKTGNKLGSGHYVSGNKRTAWKFVGKKPRPVRKGKPKKLVIEKPISGEKNGGTRLVSLVKRKKSYPTCNRVRQHPSRNLFRTQRRYLRSSLTPGKIVILLAGVHKGRRAIFLKQLKSGLLLITGPHTLNSVPLRRIEQSYVIATSTQVDLSGVDIPSNINDAYFKRIKPKKTKKEEGDIFVSKKKSYRVSSQRKADQKIVDKQVMSAIRKMKRYKLIQKYLRAMFSLKAEMLPHKMCF